MALYSTIRKNIKSNEASLLLSFCRTETHLFSFEFSILNRICNYCIMYSYIGCCRASVRTVTCAGRPCRQPPTRPPIHSSSAYTPTQPEWARDSSSATRHVYILMLIHTLFKKHVNKKIFLSIFVLKILFLLGAVQWVWWTSSVNRF